MNTGWKRGLKLPAGPPAASRRTALSLVELLTVVAVLMLLLALLMPALQKVRDAGLRAWCASNLRQIGIAFNLYAEHYNGSFPNWYNNHPPDNAPVGWSGRMTRLIHSLDSYAFGDEYNRERIKNVWHCPVIAETLNIFNIQQTGWTWGTVYTANIHILGDNDRLPLKLGQIQRPGLTAVAADSRIDLLPSWEPAFVYESNLDPTNGCRVGMVHSGGGNVLFVDGHVRRLSPTQRMNDAIVQCRPPGD